MTHGFVVERSEGMSEDGNEVKKLTVLAALLDFLVWTVGMYQGLVSYCQSGDRQEL